MTIRLAYLNFQNQTVNFLGSTAAETGAKSVSEPFISTPASFASIGTQYNTLAVVDPGGAMCDDGVPLMDWGWYDGGTDPEDFVSSGLSGSQVTLSSAFNGKTPVVRLTYALGDISLDPVFLVAASPISGGVDVFPADIPSASWTVVEEKSLSPVGRRTVTLSSSYTVPSGFTVRFNSSNTDGGIGADTATVQITPGVPFTTTSGLGIGTDCHNNLYFRRTSDGLYRKAHPDSDQKSFEIEGPDQPAAFPTNLTSAQFSATEAASPNAGKVTVLVASTVTVASGFSLRYNTDTTSGGPATPSDSNTAAITPGTAVTTSTVLAGGTVTYTNLYWKRASDGVYQKAHLAADQKTVTIATGTAADFPSDIADGSWTVAEGTGDSEGLRLINVNSAVSVPTGFTLRYNSSTSNGGPTTPADGNTTALTPGTQAATGDAIAQGVTTYTNLYWKRASDNAYKKAHAAADQKIVVIGGAGTGVRLSGVTQNGVTFSFAQVNSLYPLCGQYHNGDYWAIAPVTITAITPTCTRRTDLQTVIQNASTTGRWIHGTVLNHGNAAGKVGGGTSATSAGGQGFDSLINNNNGQTQPYNHSFNIDPEATVNLDGTGAAKGSITFAAGEEGSVVKSISLTGASGTGAWESKGRPTLRDLVVLTVVADTPASGSLRPSPARTSKAAPAVVSSLNLAIFPNLALPDTAPTVSSILSRIERLHSHACTNGTLQNTYARNNQDNPGRDYSYITASAGLLLCGDITSTQRRQLAEAVAQLGSDIYWRYQEGGMWIPDGQLNYGRKIPLVLAALMLNNSGMLTAANGSLSSNWRTSWKAGGGGLGGTAGPRFAEDGSTYYITQARIDTPPQATSKDANPEPYVQSDLGKPEWEIERFYNGIKGNRKVGTAYRNNVIMGIYGAALTAHLVTGARTTWNYPAFFDYCDYFKKWAFAFAQNNLPNAVPDWHQSMWTSYRSRGGTVYSLSRT